MIAWLLAGLMGSAWADDAVRFEVVRVVEHGKDTPRLVIHPSQGGAVKATVTCGDRSWKLDSVMAAGKPLTLALTGIVEGPHACEAVVAITAADGSDGEATLPFEVISARPLGLTATLADYDRAGQRFLIHADRALASGHAVVRGPGGAVLDEVDAVLDDAQTLRLTWDARGAEVVRVDVEAVDTWGMKSVLWLSPWWYAIPHEDVVFASGSADVVADEAPKLERSWEEIQSVLTLYGDVVTIRLFVTGYTDTVGDPASNQGLSERRARALAAWFRARGFKGEVSYQGFGESVLAVPTGDGVDEARNRRALYLLAAEVPPVSTDVPRAAWKKL